MYWFELEVDDNLEGLANWLESAAECLRDNPTHFKAVILNKKGNQIGKWEVQNSDSFINPLV